MMRRAAYVLLIALFALGMGGEWPNGRFVATGYDGPGVVEEEALYGQAALLVEERAVVPPKDAVLLKDSLGGMLHALDPHSSYYTPKVFKDLMEDQHGEFSGLGMLVTKPGPNSPLLVVTPIPNTPASRAGIRAGDLILEVDGAPTAKMTSMEAVMKLKGPKGTRVSIKVGRGEGPPAEITLKRAEIPKYTVPYSFMVGKGEGYVKINTFGQTTPGELKKHLKQLHKQGMTSLILDLRDNPGGSFPAAIDVASLFLRHGQEVVSIRGRRKSLVHRYRVDRDGKYADLPMAILINRGSASASEIVTGALQDHDRALVVGVRSWGKGLVQTLTPLENRGAVAITTARYYTPSGRLIQRDYSKSYDAYYFPDEQPKGKPPEAPHPQKAFTDAGRVVYGGGGIEPDVVVKAGLIPPLALKFERRRLFLNFIAPRVESGRVKDADSVSPALMKTFRKYAAKKAGAFTEAEWKDSDSYILHALKREVMTMLQGQGAGYRAMAPLDLQLAKAEALLSSVHPGIRIRPEGVSGRKPGGKSRLKKAA